MWIRSTVRGTRIERRPIRLSFDRAMVASALSPNARDHVFSRQIQAGPQELWPETVRQYPWVRTDLTTHRTGQLEGATGMKPARNPSPLLAIMEEGTRHCQMARLCS